MILDVLRTVRARDLISDARIDSQRRRCEERAAAERAAELQRRLAAEQRDLAISTLSARTAVAACAAVLARYPRRDQPKGARSAEAKRRRRKAHSTKQATRLQHSGDDGAHCGSSSNGGAVAAAEARAVAAERRADAAEQRAAIGQTRAKLATKRAKRDVGAAGKRAVQAERSHGKAAKRKAIAAREWASAAAARKEARLELSGKRPAGEPLHSGDRKRQRLLEDALQQLAHGRNGSNGSGGSGKGNGGRGGGGRGGGKGGSGKGGGGRGSGGRSRSGKGGGSKGGGRAGWGRGR